VPAELADAAADTLGGAGAVAAQLPAADGAALLHAANSAFVSGLHLTSVVAAVIAAGLAALAAVALRTPEPAPTEDAIPVPCPS
jgi:DHA2 family multidrug resistance protein-like MFS transporter